METVPITGSVADIFQALTAPGPPQGILLEAARPYEGRQVSILAFPDAPGNKWITGGGGADPWPEALRRHLDREVRHEGALPTEFLGGVIGVIGYEARRALGLPVTFAPAPLEALFLAVSSFLVVDDQAGEVFVVSIGDEDDAPQRREWGGRMKARLLAQLRQRPTDPSHGEGGARPLIITPREDARTYREKVKWCQEKIRHGDSYELCLTTSFIAEMSAPPWEVYRALRSVNPAPFAAYIGHPEIALTSASPERFLKLSVDGAIEAKPIKGTRPRGATVAADAQLKSALGASVKDRAENLMIVDLLRHDIGGVAVPGTVTVPVFAGIESYQTVHQLVSTIVGQRQDGLDALDVISACFPGGSMTGAPKIRSMTLLEQIEGEPRGLYSGALGWISHTGAAEMSIVIRAICQRGRYARIGAGGAITTLSDPMAEYREMKLKAAASFAGLALAESGDPTAYRLAEEGGLVPMGNAVPENI
ncbi:putative para-aminobenzoate synthase [Parvularcula bermudensis HTCC2503]|uniref:Putative para-aminobenzoate synthase n=1 Tax=Parvularcula bermudensis (strain ATCC BAA-594 / HTCC2503 / KCTC 12087) TaxID=314260 RepID=E0TCH9_PARBH|nr:putative para-aminobenzoate synthase [Parvularcula bermudensis HTCC2503]